jgi:hypothetical protein
MPFSKVTPGMPASISVSDLEESAFGVRRPYQRLGGIIPSAVGRARTAIKAGMTQTSIGIIAESQPVAPLATRANALGQPTSHGRPPRKAQALEIIQGGGGTNVLSRVDPGEFASAVIKFRFFRSKTYPATVRVSVWSWPYRAKHAS